MPLRPIILVLISFTWLLSGHAQDTTKILLEQATTWEYNQQIRKDVQRIIGNVILSHDSAYLYCDSAYLNELQNDVLAYGNVHIMISDTLNIYGDSLKYSGNTRVARLLGNAKLVDNQTILTTDTLVYDRNTRIATYDRWGKIVNGKNVLVSRYGYYYTSDKEFFFKEKVLAINPDFTLHSDTLKYNTVTEVAYFFGPSHIIGKDDSLYTENGWYNTITDEARFRKNGKVYHKEQILTGDSMYYNRETGYGQVWKNGYLKDTANNIIMMGDYGEVIREQKYAFMTDRAVMAMVDDEDTLFMHSDTVKGYFDSAQNIKTAHAYYGVKFYRHDLQGVCDSLVYTNPDSVMVMYRKPVIWSEENQLTADTIRLVFSGGEPDSIVLVNSAFIISQDDSSKYNQIKGRDIVGYFLNSDLYKIRVLGNSETIYFVREEDKTLIGVNKAVASDMLIFLEDSKISDITYIMQPVAKLFPEKDLTPYDLKLRGFEWHGTRRPLKKEDIFLKD